MSETAREQKVRIYTERKVSCDSHKAIAEK